MPGKPHEDPRQVLARHGLTPKRSFSQNFLVAPNVVDKIAAAVPAAPGEVVVELGPGVGTLTMALVRRGLHVHAVERDRDMIALLRAESVDEVEVHEGDAATVDYATLAARYGGPRHVVGNLPYAITGAILRGLVDGRKQIASAVIMVQKEVRDRLLAEPGTKEYGALTVFVTAAFRLESVCVVPPGCFHPAPKVASAVLRLVPHDPPRAEETEAFRRVVKAAFEQRRKMLRASLRTLGEDDDVVARALAAAHIDPTLRAERLSVEDFARLTDAITSCRATAPDSTPDDEPTPS